MEQQIVTCVYYWLSRRRYLSLYAGNNKLLPVCITGCRGGGTYLSILIIEEGRYISQSKLTIEEGRYMSQYTDHRGGEVHISVY